MKITITIEIDGQSELEPEKETTAKVMVHEDPYYTAMHGEDQPSYPTVDDT